MTITSPFLRECAMALQSILGEGRFADSVIQRTFKNNRHWQKDERSLFAESIYAILKNWRRLWKTVHRREPSLETPLLEAIVLGLYKINGLPDGITIQRSIGVQTDTASTLQERWKLASDTRAIKYSLPDWLDSLGDSQCGRSWESIAEFMMTSAPTTLRTNTLKITKENLKNLLSKRGIHVNDSAISLSALVISNTEYVNVFGVDEFKKGYYEMQDAGSQTIAPFCEVASGMRVADACAGSGGKSLHLAQLMGNKGRIVALDTEEWKLEETLKRARRSEITIIETKHIHSTKVVKRLAESFDRVLLDVPCSGLGVLRRNPDSKWHLSPNDIEGFVKTQRDILKLYSSMVKPNGKLIYATCSVLPLEGEEQRAWFLEHFPDWQLDAEQRINPIQHNCDGFYMARFVRKH
jgi:16S rRNA (cytosine967-C5)-methyltransferase